MTVFSNTESLEEFKLRINSLNDKLGKIHEGSQLTTTKTIVKI